MARIAVITGDLVDSTRASNGNSYLQALKSLLQQLGEQFGALSTQYRGDGFQLILDADQFNTLEAVVLLRTGLISQSPPGGIRWDARAAIAFGTGAISLTDQNSEAFIHSGRTLDAMTKARIRIHVKDEVGALAIDVATRFADDLVSELTPVEAEVLYYYYRYKETHQQLADRLGKQRPTVTEALKRSKYSLLDGFVQDINRFLSLTGA